MAGLEPPPENISPSSSEAFSAEPLWGIRLLGRVVNGLTREPLLLWGFGTLLLLSTVVQFLGSAFATYGWLLLAVYTLTTLSWLATRSRPRRDPRGRDRTRLSVRGSRDVSIDDTGSIRGRGEAQRRTHVTVRRAKGVRITGSGNIGSADGLSPPKGREGADAPEPPGGS
ncbi:hypothetical protein GCM10023347_23430 [Streptomyces chumphonensis]|uniref:Uncharacterized protein n=1 Tax=Streptomyces chumphonensis TaxID=1214925 RepID=A0A927IAW2_9ACTN|nr:hypothetical protein [Streptomyces chumphonensis]MBD3930165.1 hypothetical protein [Streptomyces chumphonensis]